MSYHDYITRTPAVCNGQFVFVGTRIPIRTVLASLADGDNEETLLKNFPTLSRDHVHAAIAFAAESAIDDMP